MVTKICYTELKFTTQINTKMSSITNLFIPHATWTGWQTASHLIFHTRYREEGGQATGMWFISDGADCCENDRTFIRVQHCGVTADTGQGRGRWWGPRRSIPLPCSLDGHIRGEAIVRHRDRPQTLCLLSQWALFWLSDSCPNKYSNMAIVGVRFSKGNVIWAKCD